MSEERKLVTILFSDVTGSTNLGESMDPEDLRALMGRYYEHAREIIGSFGGTVEKFIGDAVMAVFGLPVAHDDDAERALAAALALREAIRQDALLGESFQLRMGVNSGEVMATTDTSRSDFLVTGDTVNAAARLQQSASPGEIIVSERTAQAAHMAFVFLEPREIEVKGKQLPLRVFPLKERRSTRLVERPPLVGRRQDLLQLEVLRERTLEEERPEFISITAPAGTGKTRLLEEFLSGLDPAEGFRVAAARCQPYGESMAYLPLQGFLQELLGTEVSREQVIKRFVESGYPPDDASRLAEYVLSTLGIGSGKSGVDRELIFNAWRLLVETLARQALHIIYFENLHWASESLLDLVEHIASSRAQACLLVITLSRSELLDRRPNWGGGRQSFTALALQPLSAKRTLELVRRLAPSLPEAVSAKIAGVAGGNPFFAQELVRGMAERHRVDADASADILPDTIHAAVLARLDLLSRTEREVLQVASVTGRTFTSTLLQNVLPAYSVDEIATALDDLLARDMIAAAPGGAFTFHYSLVQDITYGTLSRAERIRLHKAIAAALLEEAGEEYVDESAEVLAYHYYKAVQLSKLSAVPPNLAVETERAIKFQVRAGELASRSGAPGEAQTYFQRAIELADAAEKVELYEKLAGSLESQWREKIRQAYLDGLALWRTLPEPQPLLGARLMRKLIIVNNRQYFTDKMTKEEAEALWAEARQLAERAGNEDEIWRVRTVALFMQYDLEPLSVEEMKRDPRVPELKQLAVEAAGYFEERHDWEAVSEILDAYDLVQFRCGESSGAMATIRRRLQLPDLSFRERADAISSLSGISFLSGEYDACIQLMAETLDNLHPGEPLEAFANSLNGPLAALYMTGRWSEIPRFQRVANELWERVREIPGIGMLVRGSYTCLLMIALAREDQAEIEAIEAMVRKLSPELQDVETLPFIEFYRDGNLSHYEVGNRTTDVPGFQMMLFTEHGQIPPDALMNQEGDYFADEMTLRASKIARALQAGDNLALARAIDEAEEHQLAVHAARMRIVLAERTGDLSQIARARPVLERLEDRLFLRRLGEVEEMLRVKAR